MDEITVARFWSHVDKNGPVHPALGTKCWVWIGATDKDGYGVFGVSTTIKTMRASRVAWLITNGDPGESLVLHHCDNPPCCNPAHLFDGTPLANMQDKVAKGRHRHGVVHLCGEQHGNAILTDVLVQQIRSEYIPRKVTLAYLAKKHGVALSSVHYALHIGWKHLG